MRKRADFFFTYDFFPKVGGAHLWLYKVACYWPRPAVIVTSGVSSGRLLRGFAPRNDNDGEQPRNETSHPVTASKAKQSLGLLRPLTQPRNDNDVYGARNDNEVAGPRHDEEENGPRNDSPPRHCEEAREGRRSSLWDCFAPDGARNDNEVAGDRNNSSICHYEEAQSADEVIFPKEHPLEIIRFPFCVSSWGIDRNFFKNTYLLWQFFKKIEKPITIHVVKAIPEAANLLWLKFLWKDKLKIVTYAHGEEFLVAKTSKELGWLTRQALRISDLVIANSFSTKRLASEFCDENKIHVVHLGVDFEQYQIPEEECQKYRQKWGFPENTVILLTVARMEPRKNQAAVIKTVAELRKEGLPLAYVIAGSGEEERKLKNMVQEYNLEPWVKFLGKISEEEKIKSFCAADIYVMPSIQVGPMIEGFGIVFMEAAAAGLPSIAGNIGGQPEAVRHEETGFVIDGNNLNELKEAIRRLAQDKNLRQKMGETARLWARKHDWSLVSRRVYEVVSHV